MTLPKFEFSSPKKISEACTQLKEPESCLLAGGTDLLVKMKRGEISPKLIVSLAKIPELKEINTTAAKELNVGPLSTMSSLEQSSLLTNQWAALKEGAASVGGPIIRNRATVGGNIINARPCADSVAPLIALDAKLQLQSAKDTRTVDLDGFITGPGQTGLNQAEVLSGITLPFSQNAGSSYLKLIRRAAMEVTLVGCAASLWLEQGKIVKARIVLASVAPILLRITAAEKILVGQTPSEELFKQAALCAKNTAKPIDDHRGTAEYRSEMIAVLAQRTLTTAFQRAQS